MVMIMMAVMKLTIMVERLVVVVMVNGYDSAYDDCRGGST